MHEYPQLFPIFINKKEDKLSKIILDVVVIDLYTTKSWKWQKIQVDEKQKNERSFDKKSGSKNRWVKGIRMSVAKLRSIKTAIRDDEIGMQDASMDI